MSTATARDVVQVMGMPVSVALRGRHAGTRLGRDAWAAAVASLQDADRIFSTYREDSAVRRIDRGELTVADAPPEVREVLSLGARARSESAGAFSVWRRGPDGRRRLDPSGVVKGWAVERAAANLANLDATDFCLSAGGDLTCRTLDPDVPPWWIGIEDPADPRRLVATVPVSTGAVATSGRAHRGGHVVDARSGRPVSGLASVTVVGGSLTWVDIEATAAFALGAAAVTWLRTRPGRTAVVVADDGTATTLRGTSTTSG